MALLLRFDIRNGNEQTERIINLDGPLIKLSKTDHVKYFQALEGKPSNRFEWKFLPI